MDRASQAVGLVVVLGVVGAIVSLINPLSFNLRGAERDPYTTRAISAVLLVLIIGFGIWWFSTHPLPRL